MLGGIFIQAEEGILLGDRIADVAADGSFVYEAIEYSTASPSVNLFSMMLVLIGGALTAYSGIAFVFSGSEKSQFHYWFVRASYSPGYWHDTLRTFKYSNHTILIALRKSRRSDQKWLK